MCSMKATGKSTIVDNFDEEYYQISTEILSSFPKFRPPLDLYILKEDTLQIQLLRKKGERMDKDVQEQVAELCKEGNIFVARTDHPIYSKHIAKQLDLVLVDENLKEGEIAEIFSHAITDCIAEFFEQPVKAVFTKLYNDLMVLTEYLWEDKTRIKALTRRLHTEHTLENHSFNTGIIGLWLYLTMHDGGFTRRTFDKIALSLFLHDMGMSKIPPFMRTKPKALTPDEQTKIAMHPLAGSKVALKLGLKFEEMQQCIMEHHERLDGTGYPARAKQISTLGGICAVADSYCAMITKRPFAEAMEPQDAARELVKENGKYLERPVKALVQAVLTDQW